MTRLQLGYLLLSLLMSSIILYGYGHALKKINTPNTVRTKRMVMVGAGILGWWTYAFFLAKSGFLKDYSLPPRFPLLTIIPLFLFTGILLYKRRNSSVIKAIPAAWPVYYQSFRILVESLFVATVAAGALHKEVTIEGYNYDMIFAFTAPIAGLLVFRLGTFQKKVALYWNYLGLVVIAFIIFLFTTTTYFPQVWGHEMSHMPMEFLEFPYLLVAAFLMPSAVFVHVLSIVQLTRKG